MNLNQPCLVPCGCTSVDGRKCRRGDIRNTRDLVRCLVGYRVTNPSSLEPDSDEAPIFAVCPADQAEDWSDVSVHRKCARRFLRRFFSTVPRGSVRVYEVTHSIE